MLRVRVRVRAMPVRAIRTWREGGQSGVDDKIRVIYTWYLVPAYISCLSAKNADHTHPASTTRVCRSLSANPVCNSIYY